MFTFFLLIFVAAFAKLEQYLVPELLKRQEIFLRDYRFINSNGWFCRLCRTIPTECPAQKIGLPPMCKLNPLYDVCVLLKMKAQDIAHQDELIAMAVYM